MAIITAQQALAMTRSKDVLAASLIEKMRVRFDQQVRAAAHGNEREAGRTYIRFGIDAVSELQIYARDKFIEELKAAQYAIRLEDSNDDGDYFAYRIDWTPPEPAQQ